jgi:GT2 family glycosyltransferase
MKDSTFRHDRYVGGEGLLAPGGGAVEPADPFPPSLVLSPTSRWPTLLPEATVRAVLAKPLPCGRARVPDHPVGAACRRASVVVVTYNNLVYTRLCLESLLANADPPGYEVIVVDNGSTDGTPEYLGRLRRQHPQVRVVSNPANLGFARANNQGLARATGDLLVLLNNDTIVPHGALTRLLGHLRDPAIGLIGPVTNRTGNEAQIEAPYRTYGELARFARDHARAHAPTGVDLRMLAMFCVALRRDVYEGVGPLDERFGIGLFEDEDYALRVRAAGYRVVCAEDVFVHHFGQASIGKLARTGEYGELFHANRRRWEEKWRTPWQPYQRRPNLPYQHLTERIRQVVGAAVPPGATVLVVSKGDDELLRLGGRPAWHFPQAEGGAWAGHHPADSAAAIAHLEALRHRGADFLLLPQTALWWLEHYAAFGQHLEARYRRLPYDDCCILYQLSGPAAGGTETGGRAGQGGRPVSQGREEKSSHLADGRATRSGKG